MSPTVVLTIVVEVALLVFFPSPTLAQVRARTEPLTADRVVLEVHVEGEAPATVHVRNGQMARVRVAGAQALGLTPVIDDGKIQLVLLEISIDETTGHEGLRQLARQELAQGTLTRLDVLEPTIEVAWLQTLPPAAALSAELGPCTECCVWCGTVLFCACVVITECGRCCCSAVCECPFPPDGNGWNTSGCPAVTAGRLSRGFLAGETATPTRLQGAPRHSVRASRR